MREYSPLSVILLPSSSLWSGDEGSKVSHVAVSSGRPNLAKTRATSSATCPRSRPSTPIVRSIVAWRFKCVTSAGTLDLPERNDVRERDGLLLHGTGNGDIQQRFDRLDVFFRILHADVILVLADGIDPEVVFVELDAGVQGRHHVLHHVVLVQPQVGGLGAIDVDHVLGIIEPLQDTGIDDPVDLRDLALDLSRPLSAR